MNALHIMVGGKTPATGRHKAHIEEYRQMFTFDSVASQNGLAEKRLIPSTLVANLSNGLEEVNAQFAQAAAGFAKGHEQGAGATVIVLHHTAKSGIGDLVALAQ